MELIDCWNCLRCIVCPLAENAHYAPEYCELYVDEDSLLVPPDNIVPTPSSPCKGCMDSNGEFDPDVTCSGCSCRTCPYLDCCTVQCAD